MNKSLAANANFRIRFLNCHGGRMKRKNNTICNSNCRELTGINNDYLRDYLHPSQHF